MHCVQVLSLASHQPILQYKTISQCIKNGRNGLQAPGTVRLIIRVTVLRWHVQRQYRSGQVGKPRIFKHAMLHVSYFLPQLCIVWRGAKEAATFCRFWRSQHSIARDYKRDLYSRFLYLARDISLSLLIIYTYARIT